MSKKYDLLSFLSKCKHFEVENMEDVGMAFFDEISTRLSQAGQSAVQKTKDMTEIARLNTAITEEEKKLKGNYYQVGKLYFAVHTDDFESGFGEMIAAILNSEEKIRTYRQQIQDIKGVLCCEKCGAEVTAGVAFCSACGTPVVRNVPTEATNQTVCSGCGAQLEQDMQFCTTCGKPTAETFLKREFVATKQQEPVRRVCINCKAEVSEGMAFCSVCGTRQ